MGTRKNSTKVRHIRIRRKLAGTPERPRLAVHFSGRHVYAQVIDDTAGRTLAAVVTTEAGLRETAKANVEVASKVGQLVAERAKKQNINQLVFDRGAFRSHGKVKALADAARAAGLDF